MSFWTKWLFGRGRHVPREGTAHSSDRHGFWKDLWKLRKALQANVDHSGSVDIYDHFGCPPYNDNDVKRERRARARPILQVLAATAGDAELRDHAARLLAAFDQVSVS